MSNLATHFARTHITTTLAGLALCAVQDPSRAALFKEFQDSLRDMLTALEKSECEASS
jgi:hypothetical protein